MKRKYYITPLVAFSNIEPEADMLVGSPENNGSTALHGEFNPMVDDVNGMVQEGDGPVD